MEKSKKMVLVALGLSLLAVSLAQPLPSRTYTYSKEMFNDGGSYFKLYWNVDAPNDLMQVAIVCLQPEPGWCSVGWSLDSLMVGSDAVIGSIDGNGQPQIFDFQLRAQVPPGNGTCPAGVCADGTQIPGCADQLTSKIGQRVGNYMVLEFARPISASDSCDSQVVLDSQTQFVIVAWGIGNAPLGILRHTNYGNNNATEIYWNPPVLSTGAVTTAGVPVTSGALTSGASVTTGLSPQVTTGLSVTTGVAQQVTSGVANTGVAVTTGGSQNQGSESASSGLFGFAIWQFALIIVAAVLVLIIIIVTIVVVVLKKGKKKEYFGGFY